MLFDVDRFFWRSVVRGAGLAAVFVVLAAAAAPAPRAAAQTPPGSPGPFDGRWVIDGDPWFSTIATGRGGRGGAPAAGPDVVIDLKVGPGGTVSGIATGVSGTRGAPGSHPAHPVEITRGRLEGGALTFEIWRFDGYHNRLHVQARPEGDELVFDFRREAPGGPVTFTTRGRRVEQ